MPDPRAKLTGHAPILLVRDPSAAAEHYRDCLGFTLANTFGEPPAFIILHRDGLHLMLADVEKPEHVVPHWNVREKTVNVYFWVDEVELLFREFTARGAKIDYGLCDQPYGCREFGIQDLDGYDIAFGQVID